MSNFSRKLDLDNHVLNYRARLKSDYERKLRAKNFAKLYYLNKEFSKAAKYLAEFLSVKNDCPVAYKLQGKIQEALVERDAAVQSYMKSLELDPTQTDLFEKIMDLIPYSTLEPEKVKLWTERLQLAKKESDLIENVKICSPVSPRFTQSPHNSPLSPPGDELTTPKSGRFISPKTLSPYATKVNFEKIEKELILLSQAQEVVLSTVDKIEGQIDSASANLIKLIREVQTDVEKLKLSFSNDISKVLNDVKKSVHVNSLMIQKMVSNQPVTQSSINPSAPALSTVIAPVVGVGSSPIPSPIASMSSIGLAQSPNFSFTHSPQKQPFQFTPSPAATTTSYTSDESKKSMFSASPYLPISPPPAQPSPLASQNFSPSENTSKPLAGLFNLSQSLTSEPPKPAADSWSFPKQQPVIPVPSDPSNPQNKLNWSQPTTFTPDTGFSWKSSPSQPSMDPSKPKDQPWKLPTPAPSVFKPSEPTKTTAAPWDPKLPGTAFFGSSESAKKDQVLSFKPNQLATSSKTQSSDNDKSLSEFCKQNTWECSGCYMQNNSSSKRCPSCDTPQPGVPQPAIPAFQFGGFFSQQQPKADNPVIETAAGDADFEIVYVKEPESSEMADKAKKLQLPVNFYDYVNAEPCIGCRGCDEEPPEEKPTPEKGSPKTEASPVPASTTEPSSNLFSAAMATFGITQSTWGTETNFFSKPQPVFAPRQQQQTTSAEDDESGIVGGEDTGGSENAVFKLPSIQVPDIVEVKTGEEDEQPVFTSRAKVYLFSDNDKEWKERGIGEFKILKHMNTNAYRMLLRRDKVLKIACNQRISPALRMEPMVNSETALTWAGVDFSEAEEKRGKFCIKFKNTDLKNKFLSEVEKIQSQLSSEETKKNME